MTEPEAVGMSSARLARIRPALEKHIGPDKMAGAVTLVARRDQIVHLEAHGLMDRENNRPMPTDAIFTIQSMTKPIICTALMILYERGEVHMWDPVSKFIPAFDNLKVLVEEANAEPRLVDLERPVTIRDLLLHTSGITANFNDYGLVEQYYREGNLNVGIPLSDFIANLVQLPLAFQPGAGWRYGLSHDVVARVIEIISGQSVDVFLAENLFEPLGMVDTGYYVPQAKWDRLASLYGAADLDEEKMTLNQWFKMGASGMNRRLAGPSEFRESKPHHSFRGSEGLVSTATDYWHFCQMLLNNGELQGHRILGRKTVEFMTMNQIPDELLPFEINSYNQNGYGYGLGGVRVLLDVAETGMPGSKGLYGWSGAAGSFYWVDPVEAMIGIIIPHFQPPIYPSSPAFRRAAYQAIID